MRKAICVNSKCNKQLFKHSVSVTGRIVIKCKCGTLNEFVDGKLQNYSLHNSRNVLDTYQNNLKLNKKNG